uniref:Uncharacterized protein n=1 Tax=Arundo donax TaxID=35708 RepID=A0A0A8YSS2_ARUDO
MFFVLFTSKLMYPMLLLVVICHF